MKIQSEIQAHKPTPATSFFLYTQNNDGHFQRYVRPDLFDAQMRASSSAGLLVYEHPAHLIADALMSADYDGSEWRQWVDEAEQHLTILRQHRRRMLCIDRDVTDTTQSITAFKKAFATAQIPDEFAPVARQAAPLHTLIGLFAVRQHQPLAQMLVELEASSAFSNTDAPALDDSLAFIAKGLMNASVNSSKEQTLIDENRAQISRIEAHEQKILAEGAETNEILMQQILDLQTSLQNTDARRIDDERKNAALKAEVTNLKTTIDLIHKSTSWRITSPVRAVKGVFSR